MEKKKVAQHDGCISIELKTLTITKSQSPCHTANGQVGILLIQPDSRLKGKHYNHTLLPVPKFLFTIKTVPFLSFGQCGLKN